METGKNVDHVYLYYVYNFTNADVDDLWNATLYNHSGVPHQFNHIIIYIFFLIKATFLFNFLHLDHLSLTRQHSRLSLPSFNTSLINLYFATTF